MNVKCDIKAFNTIFRRFNPALKPWYHVFSVVEKIGYLYYRKLESISEYYMGVFSLMILQDVE